MELMHAIVETEPLRPSEAAPEALRRQLRGDLDTIIGKALKKAPAERYMSVVAFADALSRYLQLQPIGARPDATLYRAGKFVRRHRPSASHESEETPAMTWGADSRPERNARAWRASRIAEHLHQQEGARRLSAILGEVGEHAFDMRGDSGR